LWLCLLAVATGSVAQGRRGSDQLTPSEHRPGPNGLEGWTLEGPIPDHPGEKFPFTLVIARNGRVIRRFSGEFFVWKWMFLDDGKRVAYEAGPLHFSLACILADIQTGKQLGTYDCFPNPLPADAPEWVKTLEASP
jgi:hypothetical protein